MLRCLVERDHLQQTVRLVQNCAAGRLVYASRLHADETVFYQIRKSHAVFAADLVEFFDDFHCAERFAVDRRRNTLFKVNRQISRLVGRL